MNDSTVDPRPPARSALWVRLTLNEGHALIDLLDALDSEIAGTVGGWEAERKRALTNARRELVLTFIPERVHGPH